MFKCLCIVTHSLLFFAPSLQAQSAVDLFRQAQVAALKSDRSTAIQLAKEAVAGGIQDSSVQYFLGRQLFCDGQVQQAVAAFDEYVRLEPKQAIRLWERGIALYYAGKFDEGAQQFESYQQFHGNDVENAVWHLLCLGRSIGIPEARKKTLPIPGDRRVPMMEIYRLFQGTGTVADVDAAVEGKPSVRMNERRDAFMPICTLDCITNGPSSPKKALQRIRLAAEHSIPHYMGDVARVHLQLRQKSGNVAEQAADNEAE
ncbi:MAG: hypothetical protein R3C28_29015 [Pirellulaceae bacterium]